MNWEIIGLRKAETAAGNGYNPDPLIGPGGRPIANPPPASLLEQPTNWNEKGTEAEFFEDAMGAWHKSDEFRARQREYDTLFETAQKRWDEAHRLFDQRQLARLWQGMTPRGQARAQAARTAELQRWGRREALIRRRDAEIAAAQEQIKQEITARWQPQITAAYEGRDNV